MKKLILLTTLPLCMLFSHFSLHGSDYSSQINRIESEITKGNVSGDRKALLLSSVNHIQNRVLKKIKRNESRLIEYKTNLNTSESDTESQNCLKKIESIEKKNQALYDYSQMIEMLKMRLMS